MPSINGLDEKKKELASPTNKFLLGRFTIVHVISGSIKVKVEGSQSKILETEHTLVCEREENCAPTDVSMTPVTDEPAKVLMIQLMVFKSERGLESPAITPMLPPVLSKTRGQSGSLGEFQLDPKAQKWESVHRYKPPVFAERIKNESDVPPPVVRDSLVIEEFPMGTISTAWINMVKEGFSEWIRIPVIIAR